MYLIMDGMDQNTTMVPKLRQVVKGIEGRYVKTHLCGVLVHGEGLYSDVWINVINLFPNGTKGKPFFMFLTAITGNRLEICVAKNWLQFLKFLFFFHYLAT